VTRGTFGVRRQSAAATAPWISSRRLWHAVRMHATSAESKAAWRFASRRTPKHWRVHQRPARNRYVSRDAILRLRRRSAAATALLTLAELRAEQAKVGGRFAGHCTSKRQPPQTNLTRPTVLSLNRRRRLPLSEHETYENPQGDEPGRRQTDPYRPTGGLGAGGDEVDQHWFADFCLQHLRK